MTYEDRVLHRQLVERTAALRERLAEGEPWESVTREEALELTSLVEDLVDRLRPERWDHLMETIADEAARRAGSLSPVK